MQYSSYRAGIIDKASFDNNSLLCLALTSRANVAKTKIVEHTLAIISVPHRSTNGRPRAHRRLLYRPREIAPPPLQPARGAHDTEYCVVVSCNKLTRCCMNCQDKQFTKLAHNTTRTEHVEYKNTAAASREIKGDPSADCL